MSGALRIGTSGWAYSWPRFYPTGLPTEARLPFYASRFSTVEVNTSFYHLPRPATYARWLRETPPSFVFTLKASRTVTHGLRLVDADEPWSRFLAVARVLGARLGPVLVQLPPSFHAEPARLDRFLALTRTLAEDLGLPPLRVAIEVRHASWLRSAAVADALRARSAALVFAHSSRFPYPDEEPITAGFVYLRFHGPREWCSSRYGEEGLARWVPKIRAWRERGLDVFAYFNNDVHGYAPMDAGDLMRLAS